MGSQPIQFAHSQPAISSSPSTPVAANPARTYLLLQNDGAVDIYLKFGATAALNQGLRLLANGGSFESSINNQNLDIRAVSAICAGSSTLLVMEG